VTAPHDPVNDVIIMIRSTAPPQPTAPSKARSAGSRAGDAAIVALARDCADVLRERRRRQRSGGYRVGQGIKHLRWEPPPSRGFLWTAHSDAISLRDCSKPLLAGGAAAAPLLRVARAGCVRAPPASARTRLRRVALGRRMSLSHPLRHRARVLIGRRRRRGRRRRMGRGGGGARRARAGASAAGFGRSRTRGGASRVARDGAPRRHVRDATPGLFLAGRRATPA